MTYTEIATVIAPFPAQTGLLAKMTTSIGNWCYSILTESPSTPNHAARVNYIASVFEIAHRSPLPKYGVWKPVYTIIQAAPMSATGSTSDADVQTDVNAVMNNLLAGSL